MFSCILSSLFRFAGQVPHSNVSWYSAALHSLSSLQFMKWRNHPSVVINVILTYTHHCCEWCFYCRYVTLRELFSGPTFHEMFYLFTFSSFDTVHMSEACRARSPLLSASSPGHVSISVQWKLRMTAGWIIALGSRHHFPVTRNKWGFIT